ncbi:hypothetical protein DFH09DRAFT_1309955 [Mycena vulgaris]|nr:hypothetical protein DFH09DRAFT_1309955 [Mycena vulgaris]
MPATLNDAALSQCTESTSTSPPCNPRPEPNLDNSSVAGASGKLFFASLNYIPDSSYVDASAAEQTIFSNIKSLLRRNLLQLACLAAHIGLILMHVGLLDTGLRRWEHRMIFPVERQALVSFGATAFTTTISMLYSSRLLFLAQKLAMCRNLGTRQSLTATHDSVFSWSGIGSALARPS